MQKALKIRTCWEVEVVAFFDTPPKIVDYVDWSPIPTKSKLFFGFSKIQKSHTYIHTVDERNPKQPPGMYPKPCK